MAHIIAHQTPGGMEDLFLPPGGIDHGDQANQQRQDNNGPEKNLEGQFFQPGPSDGNMGIALPNLFPGYPFRIDKVAGKPIPHKSVKAIIQHLIQEIAQKEPCCNNQQRDGGPLQMPVSLEMSSVSCLFSIDRLFSMDCLHSIGRLFSLSGPPSVFILQFYTRTPKPS